MKSEVEMILFIQLQDFREVFLVIYCFINGQLQVRR